MESFSFTNVSKQLDLVKEEGVTFEDKQLTWDTAKDVEEVVKALDDAKVLHYLKLEGNTLGVDAAKAIGEALKKHPEFRKALWKNMFTRRLKTEIPEALKSLSSGLMFANAHLQVLDLSDNALGPNGMVGLEELLRSPVCYSLQELRLNNCGFGIGGGQMLSKALLDCYERSNNDGKPLQLKTLVAGRNRLENDGAIAIAKMLGTLGTLEEIVMPQNSIYHVGIKALAEGFKKNPKLRIINLNDNTVTYKGAEALADAISVSTNLQEINLGDCLLKSRGALFIADVLDMQHNLLETVDLSGNEIGTNAGVELAEALQKKPHLKNVNLDGNQFGADGCVQIKEIMGNGSCNPNALKDFDEDESENESENYDDDDDDGSESDTESGEEEAETHSESENRSEEEDHDRLNSDKINISFKSNLKHVNEFTESIDKNITDMPATAEAFCLSLKPCSLEMFESIPEQNKLKAFMGIINQFDDDNHIILLIFTTLKCAHLAHSSKAALEVAMDLFIESFDYAVEKNLEKRILEYYLIQLGLKDPYEKFTPLYDFKSSRYALRETIIKRKIDSELIKKNLDAYTSKLNA